MTTLKVPRTHIPKLVPVCQFCGSTARTVHSMPLADGYQRRHICRGCNAAFYSLAPYDGGDVKIQGVPFKDRELSEFEAYERMQMWSKALEYPKVDVEQPWQEQVIIALRAVNRTPRQNAIVAAVDMIERLVNSKYPKEGQ